MIDLHSHLDLYTNALDILPKVNKLNKFTLAVTTSPRAWITTSEVFKGYDNIKVALGLHPEIAVEKYEELDLLIASIPKSKYIGEVGIDGSRRYFKSLDKQEYIFEYTIKECQNAGGRIISIHSRGAVFKVLSILRKYPDNGCPILHWFSGSIEELNESIKMNCFFSVNPVMIKSKKGKDLVSRMPPKLILPESDGPFTTQNGNPIMPWQAMDICRNLSTIWDIPITDTREQILLNFAELYQYTTL